MFYKHGRLDDLFRNSLDNLSRTIIETYMEFSMQISLTKSLPIFLLYKNIESCYIMKCIYLVYN